MVEYNFVLLILEVEVSIRVAPVSAISIYIWEGHDKLSICG